MWVWVSDDGCFWEVEVGLESRREQRDVCVC